jgi:hypothetical protein
MLNELRNLKKREKFLKVNNLKYKLYKNILYINIKFLKGIFYECSRRKSG